MKCMQSLGFVFLLSSSFLGGCAYSSKVMSMGPDTYTINASSEFGVMYAKEKALNKANEFALSRGKHMIPIRVEQGHDFDFMGDMVNTYDLTFRLVDVDDPEYQRTNLTKEADLMININQ